MYYIGADHRGYELKEEIKKYLSEKDIEFIDVGTDSKEAVHFPIFAKNLAKKVQENVENKGILICGSGVGMSIVANKFKGIRAGVCLNEEMARDAKAHSNVNVLVLPADFIGKSQAVSVVRTWIGSEVLGGRYEERLKMIEEIEDENFM